MRIQEVPGQEQAIYDKVNHFQQEGFNVMEVPDQTGKGLRTFYACPPGQLPMEAQPTILRSEPWAGPLEDDGMGMVHAVVNAARVVSGIAGAFYLFNALGGRP